MYYLTTIQRFNDETPEAKSLFDYATLDMAKAAMYSTLSSSIANQAIDTVLCTILDNDSLIVKYEKWVRE